MAILTDVIFWIIVVFVVGFIGYFGKHFNRWIISKFSKKEEIKPNISKDEEIIRQELDYKVQKKKIKLEKKRVKASKNV